MHINHILQRLVMVLLRNPAVECALIVALSLAVQQRAIAQEPSALNRVGQSASAAASNAAASSPQIIASQTLPAASVPVPVAATSSSVEALTKQVAALARAVDSAASTAKQPLVDPSQDVKSLILNILSNRIDDFLFGDGKGGVGLAAQVVAVLAFVIAIIRFMLAVSMLNPATPQTRWGQFKAWTRKSGVVRGINVVIGALAVLFTGAALYVVVSARAVPDASASSIAALKEALTTCQGSLAGRETTGAKPPATSTQPPSAAAPAPEAMQRYGAACEAAIRSTEARVVQIEQAVAAIDAKQSWTLTKVLAFLAWLYVLAGITFLVVKQAED